MWRIRVLAAMLLIVLTLGGSGIGPAMHGQTIRGHYGHPLDHTVAQCQADVDSWIDPALGRNATPNLLGSSIERDRKIKTISTRELRRRVDEMMECSAKDNPQGERYRDVVDDYKWELLYRADDLIHEHGLDKEFEETRGSY